MGRRGQCGILAGYETACVLTTDAEFHAIIETGARCSAWDSVKRAGDQAKNPNVDATAARASSRTASTRGMPVAWLKPSLLETRKGLSELGDHMAPATRLVQELLEGDGTSLFAQVSAVERP
jgi:hypothetical protein